MFLTCSRVNVPCVLRAYVPMRLTCLRAHVPTCFVCSSANVSACLTCSRVNMLCVLTYSCVNVLCMPKCLRAITSNNKNKFSMTVLLRFLVLFVSFFFLRNKTVYQKYIQQAGMSLKNIYFENSVLHSGISLTRRKSLTGAITKLVHK